MSAAPDDVVRTHRVEVVDHTGRPRVVIGTLEHNDEQEPVFGIALLDEEGRHRAWLGLHAHGTGLAFARHGNVVVELGVDDPHTEVVAPGVYLHLAASDGTPAVGCRVTDDGDVEVHGLDGERAALDT